MWSFGYQSWENNEKTKQNEQGPEQKPQPLEGRRWQQLDSMPVSVAGAVGQVARQQRTQCPNGNKDRNWRSGIQKLQAIMPQYHRRPDSPRDTEGVCTVSCNAPPRIAI